MRGQVMKRCAAVFCLSWAQAAMSFADDAVLFSPAPPDTTVTVNSGSQFPISNGQGEIDAFAWKMFIAMNWPAIVPSETNGFVRGIPDTTQTFGPSNLGVWETFKEKREVFNRGFIRNGQFIPADPGPWHSPVNYGILRAATGENLTSSKLHPEGARVFHSSMKQPVNALDETIEVKSEELEPNGEHVGSAVAPRVWRYDSTTNIRTPVLYEVKVNYDFYAYLRQFGLWNDAQTLPKAKANGIHLPWRSSATMNLPGGGSSQTNQVTGYSAVNTAKAYQTFQSNKLPPAAPPLVGSVHIKAAWIALTPDEIASKTYHMADAYSYKSNAQGQPVAELSTFGLIGLHIIQRVHFSDSAKNFSGTGGNFVFATWEHNSIQNSIDNPGPKKYQYANFYDPRINGLQGKPSFGQVYDVTRRPGAVLRQTQAVNRAFHSQFPSGSVWRNYNLIGTQFTAVDTTEVVFSAPPSAAEQALGQNSYLANLVLETSHGLQNFRGLPPLISKRYIVPPYSDPNSTKPPVVGNPRGGPVFFRDGLNSANQGAGRNMGGCMGCHGVAQIQGFNFSFVLLGGNEGAKTDTQTRFDLPLAGPK